MQLKDENLSVFKLYAVDLSMLGAMVDIETSAE